MASTATFTNVGLHEVRKLLQNQSSRPSYVSYIVIGTGTTAPTAADTQIENEFMAGSTTSSTMAGYEANSKGRWTKAFSITATGSITELTLQSGPTASGGVVFSRAVLTGGDVVNVNSGDTLTINYDIDFRPV